MKRFLIIVMAVLLLASCTKEASRTVFGGPASATIVINGTSSTKATVDETDLVHSIRIYAFKHAPGEDQNDEMVGYGYYTGFTGGGPYTCTIDLSASGDIDFYVIANDEYADITSGSLSESSTRTEIEDVRIQGLAASTETVAVPMSNIMEGALTDVGSNNFSYNIKDDKTLLQVITVTVTRAMARLSLYFAKTSTTPNAYINEAVLYGMGSTVTLYPPGDSQVFGTVASTDTFMSSASEEITTINDSWSYEESALQMIDYEAYMLPSPYGSSNADTFVSDGTSDDYTEARRYALDITYTVGTIQTTKRVYLPVVDPNDHIKVMGILDYEEETQIAELNVVVVSWTTYTISDITFS